MNFRMLILPVMLFVVTGTGIAAAQFDSVKVEPVSVDDWLGNDKIRHVTGSFIVTTFSAQVAMRQFDLSRKDAIILGAGFTISLGLVKESADQSRPDNFFSWKDLVADLVGITLGVLVLNIN